MNKAVYTAALVADGGAGAENLEKWLCHGPTRRTDGPTDRKVAYRVACSRLKKMGDDGEDCGDDEEEEKQNERK